MLNAEHDRDPDARIRDAAQRSLDKEVAAFDALDPDAAAVSAKTERRILRAIHTLRTPRTHRTRLRGDPALAHGRGAPVRRADPRRRMEFLL